MCKTIESIDQEGDPRLLGKNGDLPVRKKARDYQNGSPTELDARNAERPVGDGKEMTESVFATCPECGGHMELDKATGVIFCPDCGYEYPSDIEDCSMEEES